MDDAAQESAETPESNNSKRISPQPDDLSWEVMDCSDSDSRPASEAASTPLSKPAPDAGDWILQPDTDRDVEASEISLPIIQSITSLSTLEETEKPESGVTTRHSRGSSLRDDRSQSEDESDRLIIDMSASTTNVRDLSTEHQQNTVNTKKAPANRRVLRDRGLRSKRRGSNEQNGQEDKAQGNALGSEGGSDVQTEGQQDNPESPDSGLNLVISEVQGSVPDHIKVTDLSESLLSKGKDDASAEVLISSSNGLTVGSASTAGQSESRADVKRNVIVIDPETDEEKQQKIELIHFKPGVIKLEPEERTSNSNLITSCGGQSVVSQSTNSNISTHASLYVGTSLTSASPQLMSAAALGPTNMNTAFQAFQQHHQVGHRTILKSPPKKPVPQVLVRHAGPRSRPSYIRLGSQTLQHFARLTSGPQAGMQPHQQRMISVLMDRGNNAITTNSLPHNLSHLLQAGPPGTLVNASNSGNNPVKVLILPSQASSTGQTTQTTQQGVSSAAPVYSVTTTGALGTLSSIAGSPNSKTSTAQGTPEPKSIPHIVGPLSGSKSQKNSSSKSQGQSGKSKGQGGSSKSGGSKSSKASKAAAQELSKPIGDVNAAELLQNITAAEERLKKRMLSKTNLIKDYHPALSSGLSNIAFEFYSCHGCRDVFVNKSSLEYHKDRQSMCITYNCDPCKMTYTFSNKCQFRCHMLKHVQELKQIHKSQLERIVIKPLKYQPSNQPSKGKYSVDSPTPESMEASDTVDENVTKETESVGSETGAAKDKNTEKNADSAELGDASPSLGITITSVSSVSIDDHQDVQKVASPHTETKRTESQPSLPPPLTLASSVPPPLSAPPLVPQNAQTTTTTLHTLDISAISSLHRAMGPLAQARKSLPNQVPPKTTPSGEPPVNPAPAITTQVIPAFPVKPVVQQSSEGGNIFCTECSSTFSSYMKLQRHFNDADKPHPLRPPCCNIRLATECCVRSHMRTHQNQRPYVCNDCGECFRGDLAIFNKHAFNCKRVMDSAVIVFPCPRCQEWYSKIDELRVHVREEHSESYLKCNLCPMAFKTISSFKEHNTNKHAKEKTDSANFTSIYKCPLCDSVFHDQRMKLDHLEQHINNIYANQRVSFVCQICKKLCYNYAMMRYHLKEKHMVAALGNMCDLCGVDCGPTIKHLVAHQRKIHNTFPANMLVDPFTKPDGIDKSSDKKTTDEAQGKSDLYDMSMEGTNSSSVSHEKLRGSGQQGTGGEAEENSYHGNLPRTSSMYNQTEPEEGEDGDEDGEVRCHICHQTFGSRMALANHKKTDHGLMKRKRTRGDKSPVECVKKPKQDEEEELLDETTPQFQVKSNYMLRFECDNCDYRTPTFQDLQQHQMETHGIEARFPCLLCGETHHSMASLEEHMKCTHEGQIREYDYLCWICLEAGQRKGYTKRAHLVRHFMNYHKIASKAIDSDRLDDMDRKASLTAEEKLKEERESNPDHMAKKPRISTEDNFACVKCDFECKDRQEFQAHIGKHKSGADSFQCPECGMCFSVLPPLKNHLRLVHKIKNFTRYVERSGVKFKNAETEKPRPPTRKSPSADLSPVDKNPLECTVCYRVYQDQTALKNHMRSHGMAFIRSKRLAPLAFLND